MPERWAFFLNPYKPEALEYAKELEVLLADRGIEVRKFFRWRPFSEDTSRADSSDYELVMVFGGDGTFYKAAQTFRGVPIVTVNFGTRGFLCAFKPWPPGVLYQRIKLSKRLGRYVELDTLKVRVNGREYVAVGDVAVVHSDPGKIIRLDLELEGSRLHCPADGLVIATSTGATGYALSTGGPLIEMALKVMIIAPIASQNLSLRPMIVDLSRKVRIWNVSKVQEAIVLTDGEEVARLKPREALVITRGDHKVTLLVPPDFKVVERWKEILNF